MTVRFRAAARALLGREDVPVPPPSDMDDSFHAIAQRVSPYTMTSNERMYALYGAIRHVSLTGVPGDIVECGVWRGGSCMLAALALEELGDTDRTLWLYDTFDGMPPPGDRDRDIFTDGAGDVLERYERTPGANNPWAFETLEMVRHNMHSTGYPHVRYVRGKVEDTIPGEVPERISVLRLDTDWYESTRHELEHLYPRLAPGGLLIVDDYGWWKGAKEAVDEYFADRREPAFLVRVDITGRIAVKPSG